MENFEIYIEGVSRIDGLLKHAQYNIKGQVNSTLININRRYKDFKHLRKALILCWPACFVPLIPAKQMIGNLDDNFLERRKKLLNRFLNQLKDLTYLFRSEIVQKFLFQQGEFHKTDLQQENYIDIAERYHKIFNEYEHLTIDCTEDIQNFLNFSSIALPAFEKFERSCKIALESLQVYIYSNDGLVIGFRKIGEVLNGLLEVGEIKINDREKTENPFEVLLHWIRGEILDTRAMVECVRGLLTLPEKKAEYEKRVEKKRKNHENIKQGKKGFKSILTGKSKDDQKKSAKKSLEFYEFEFSGLETISHISTVKLISIDLPSYKTKKIANICSSIKLFSELIQSELSKIKYQSSFIRLSKV